MTLPGLAGIALTVGMSVDANVLINERIREELRVGNTPLASIAAGYDKAAGTIADANVTALLGGVAMVAFGSGPIRGFGITLIIGILTSMYTAVSVSRGIATLIYGRQRKLTNDLDLIATRSRRGTLSRPTATSTSCGCAWRRSAIAPGRSCWSPSARSGSRASTSRSISPAAPSPSCSFDKPVDVEQVRRAPGRRPASKAPVVQTFGSGNDIVVRLQPRESDGDAAASGEAIVRAAQAAATPAKLLRSGSSPSARRSARSWRSTACTR